MKKLQFVLPTFVALLLAASVQAQSGVGVSPPRVEIRTGSGVQITQAVTVDNPSTSSGLSVEGILADALLQPDGEVAYLDAGANPRSLAKWISFSNLRFNLAARQTQEVRYTLRVPQDAPAGSYWSVLLFESGPVTPEAQPQQGFGVQVRVRVGHVIYVDVGNVTRNGRIAGMRYQTQREKDPNQIRINFQNTGNGILRLNGKVEIRNTSGQLVATAQVKDKVSFPGATHEVEAELEKALPPGRYVALASLDFGGNRLVGGQSNIEVK